MSNVNHKTIYVNLLLKENVVYWQNLYLYIARGKPWWKNVNRLKLSLTNGHTVRCGVETQAGSDTFFYLKCWND